MVKKVDLEPRDGLQPEQIAIVESIIKVTGMRFWIFAACYPDTNKFLHPGIYTIQTIDLTEELLSELQERRDIEDAEFFVDDAL